MAFNLSRNFFKQIKNVKFIVPRNYSNFEHQTGMREIEEKLDLTDRVAMVTGGANGIGYAVVNEFLRNGLLAVSIIDKNRKNGEIAAERLKRKYGEDKVIFFESDVTDSKKIDAAFRSTVMHYQGVDIVVNSAGIMNDSSWEEQIQTNVAGTVISTLLGLQHMSASGPGQGGIIVNISSIMGVIPSSGLPLHTMTQCGIVGFSRALGVSDQYQRTSVKVVGFCPGLTETKAFANIPNNTINQNFATEFQQEIDGCILQKPDKVAEGLYGILEKSKPGSIWIAENNEEPYEVQFAEMAASLKHKPDDKIAASM